ncbi:MAG: CoA pyrophosphatase, partial [Chloroflexi bacterium]
QAVLPANQTRPLTITGIRQALARPLPGTAAQQTMAPQPRPGEQPRWTRPANCREAAVLILLYPPSPTDPPADLRLVLTRRPEYDGAHSGQISLPGGRREGEETLETTALRETWEEIGVPPDTVQIIGRLTPLYTPPSNFCIFPFVGYCPNPPTFQPDPYEVAEIIETPLHHLFHPDTRHEEVWFFPGYGKRRVPFFLVSGHKVWGATAMILAEFITALAADPDSARPG